MPLHLIKGRVTDLRVDARVEPTAALLMPGGADVVSGRRGCRFVFRTAVSGAEAADAWISASYRSCMRLAAERGCASVAFPLLGAGTSGLTTAALLRAAYDALTDCLRTCDTDVYLVVDDRSPFNVDEDLRVRVQDYIDSFKPPVVQKAESRAARPNKLSRRKQSAARPDGGLEAAAEERPSFYAAKPCASLLQSYDSVENDREAMPAPPAAVPEREEASASLDELIRQMDAGFSLRLQMLIDSRGMDDVDCYKRANVSKQTWYKILNDPDYRPSKTTVLCFAIALRLSLSETQALLSTAGYALSHSSKSDIIVEYFISRGVWDFCEIDTTLLQFDQPTLGAYA